MLTQGNCQIRVLGSGLDYLVSICLLLASVSYKGGQGVERGGLIIWTAYLTHSRVLGLSSSKLHGCGFFRSKGINQNRNITLSFYSSSLLQRRSQPPAAVSALGESPPRSVSVCSRCCPPQRPELAVGAPRHGFTPEEVNARLPFVVAACRQAVSQSTWLALRMSLWKYLPPLTKICSCIQMVVEYLFAKWALLKKEPLFF